MWHRKWGNLRSQSGERWFSNAATLYRSPAVTTYPSPLLHLLPTSYKTSAFTFLQPPIFALHLNSLPRLIIRCPCQAASANTGDIQPEHLQPGGSYRDGGWHWARGHPHLPGIPPKGHISVSYKPRHPYRWSTSLAIVLECHFLKIKLLSDRGMKLHNQPIRKDQSPMKPHRQVENRGPSDIESAEVYILFLIYYY